MKTPRENQIKRLGLFFHSDVNRVPFGLSTTRGACVLALWATVAVSPLLAAPIHDQGRLFNTEGVVTLGADRWSQSVTVGVTGTLAGIEIFVDDFLRLLPPTIDFDFSIFDSGNPPTGAPLVSLQEAPTGINSSFPHFFDVSSENLFFEVGDTFTFALSAQQPGVGVSADYQADGQGYAGGELFKNGSVLPLAASDMAFVSYVEPVPEPRSLLLLFLAMIAIGDLVLGRGSDVKRNNKQRKRVVMSICGDLSVS